MKIIQIKIIKKNFFIFYNLNNEIISLFNFIKIIYKLLKLLFIKLFHIIKIMYKYFLKIIINLLLY